MNQPTYEETLTFIKIAHEGQERWNGDPYWTHPKRVAESLPDSLKIIGLLHDVLEDTYYVTKDLVNMGYSSEICRALDKYLTRRRGTSYADYIYNMRHNELAIKVKLADLEDNLSDLKPGQRKDKYELAQLYLRSKISEYQ